MNDLHILGICGTFMGGVAALASEQGLSVSGQDTGVYPPMSDLLAALGIDLREGYTASQLVAAKQVVIGNALSRGNESVEAVLNQGINYTSGAEWLGKTILPGRDTYAVAGTHGKTSTASILAWIFEHTGQNPGFLIGGKPGNFETSARLGAKSPAKSGRQPPFVVEADEYDTAFFDKRSKFVHYRPKVAVLNNLEFDHADIFADLDAIKTQFHHLIRSIPGNGQLIVNADDENLAEVLKMGCWTPVETFSVSNPGADWFARCLDADCSQFEVFQQGKKAGKAGWRAFGTHNMSNALAAIAAAHAGGVSVADALKALADFQLPAKRLQRHDNSLGVTLYEDFAHHPTAIEKTLQTLRARHSDARLIAVLEPRSNTMKMGVHSTLLAASLGAADAVLFFTSEPVDKFFNAVPESLRAFAHLDALHTALLEMLQTGDVVAVMSNGDFGGLVRQLTAI